MTRFPAFIVRKPGAALWLSCAVAAAALWLWVCLCLFPLSVWNDVRLAPAFALARGATLYAGENSGAVGTWIYGPLPLLLWWPATWASSAPHALMTAGAINLFITLAAIGVVCWAWPAPAGSILTKSDRVLAAALAVALWPGAAFQYLQADNVAVALGLVGNLLLVRANSRTWQWGAAVCAVACLACKQTSVGVVAAQIVWLGITTDRAAAMRHLGRCAAVGLALAGLMVAGFRWDAISLNLLVLPSRLPWTDEPFRRLADLAPELSVHLVVPALVMLLGCRFIWTRASVLLLPSLTWLCALPPSMASFMKIGGTINSLQSFLYWLPPVLVVALATVRAHRRVAWIRVGVALAVVSICAVRLARVRASTWRPLVEHYRQAEYLARSFPDEIWFPWNPLVTIYSENRFYHAEDGLYVRFLAGHAISRAHARANLPRHLCVIALQRGDTDWGIALNLLPKNARRAEFGLWTLYSWPSEPPAGPSPHS